MPRSFASSVLLLALLPALPPLTAQQFVSARKPQLLPWMAAEAVALADIDGDGSLDIIPPDGQRILFGTPNDKFDLGFYLSPVTAYPRAVAIGDVNGDGRPDQVLGNILGTALLVNVGNRKFVNSSANLPSPVGESRALTLADFDGDGDLDLISGQNGQSRLHLNDGAGRFTDMTGFNLPARAASTTSIAVGDVDGDGDLDLVLGNGGVLRTDSDNTGRWQTFLWLNDGRGKFSDATLQLPQAQLRTTSVALGDIDGDGDLDLVLGQAHPDRQPRVYVNLGGGVFSDATAAHLPSIAADAVGIVLADLDRDGDLDLVLANRREPCFLLLNAAGVFSDASQLLPQPARDSLCGIAAGDVDNDGDLDLVLCGSDPVRIWHNQLGLIGSARFVDLEGPPRFATGSEAMEEMLAADLDGDGDRDLVLFGAQMSGAQWYGPLIQQNDGTGVFTDVTRTHLLPLPPWQPANGALGDLDGDDDLDMVIVGFRTAFVYANDGRGHFSFVPGALPAMLDLPMSVALADVDGDGDRDAVMAGQSSSYGSVLTRLLLNDGRGRFTDVTATHMPAIVDRTFGIGAADLDGDGDVDLLLGNLGVTPNLRLYLNDGTGHFTDVTATHLPRNGVGADTIVVVDVDADGDMDYVASMESPAQVRLFRNDGGAKFTDVTNTQLVPPVGNAVKGVRAEDFDGDGDVDLLISGWGIAGPQLLQNDGRGTFTDAKLPWDIFTLGIIGAADVDGDGDLDLVVPRRDVMLNMTRQLHAPWPLVGGRPYLLETWAYHGSGRQVAAVHVVSLARLASPIALPPLGTWWLDVNASVVLPPQMVTGGLLRQYLKIPVLPITLGQRLHAQALLVTSPSLADWRFTNLLTDEFLR